MKALISTFSILFFLTYPLLAQKGHWEVGLNGGVNISSAVGFKDNRSNWAAKAMISPQLGFSVGYKFNDWYTFRTGINLEVKGFRDSGWINTFSRSYKGTKQFADGFVSIPFLNEFHFFNDHLIAVVGFDASYGFDWLEVCCTAGERRNTGFIGGIGTQFNLGKRLNWRLDAKFNRGLTGWRYNEDGFTLNGLKTFNISTGLIRTLKK